MKLLTQEIEKRLPALGATENVDDPLVVCKFFDPTGSWTWFVLEGLRQGDDMIFYGLVHGFEKEFGNFSLNELRSVRGRFGLRIERDIYWKPVPLSKVQNGDVR